MTNLIRSHFQVHPFHLVLSPWPIYTSIALLTLTTSGVLTMHGFTNAKYFFISAFVILIISVSFWWRDVISEGRYLGNYTLAVQRRLNMGVALSLTTIYILLRFLVDCFLEYVNITLSCLMDIVNIIIIMLSPIFFDLCNKFPNLYNLLYIVYNLYSLYIHIRKYIILCQDGLKLIIIIYVCVFQKFLPKFSIVLFIF